MVRFAWAANCKCEAGLDRAETVRSPRGSVHMCIWMLSTTL